MLFVKNIPKSATEAQIKALHNGITNVQLRSMKWNHKSKHQQQWVATLKLHVVVILVTYSFTATKVASWRRGRVSDLRPEVVGSSLGQALRRKNSGQVSHTYVPLSPGSITWYRRKLGSKQTMPTRDTVAPYSWPHSVSWCLAEGYRKRRSAPPHGPMWLGKDFTFFTILLNLLKEY